MAVREGRQRRVGIEEINKPAAAAASKADGPRRDRFRAGFRKGAVLTGVMRATAAAAFAIIRGDGGENIAVSVRRRARDGDDDGGAVGNAEATAHMGENAEKPGRQVEADGGETSVGAPRDGPVLSLARAVEALQEIRLELPGRRGGAGGAAARAPRSRSATLGGTRTKVSLIAGCVTWAPPPADRWARSGTGRNRDGRAQNQ